MSGVHLIAVVAAVATIAAIIDLSRRRHLPDRYALVWIAVGVVMAVFAVSPGLFDHLAHSMGVKNPPDLLTVLASLFLLVVCVHFSWELGRSEERVRVVAEEVALLRHELAVSRREAAPPAPDDLPPAPGRPSPAGEQRPQ